MDTPIWPVKRDWTPRKGWAYRLWLVPVAVILASAAGTAVAIERVSVRSDGGQANGPSSGPVASSYADCVPFYSDATNLIPNQGDSNAVRDVYSFDTINDILQRISVSFEGGQPNRSSQAQGFRPTVDHSCTCVAYSSDATNIVEDDTNRAT